MIMATQTSLIVQQTRIQEWAEQMIKNYVLIESNLHYKIKISSLSMST